MLARPSFRKLFTSGRKTSDLRSRKCLTETSRNYFLSRQNVFNPNLHAYTLYTNISAIHMSNLYLRLNDSNTAKDHLDRERLPIPPYVDPILSYAYGRSRKEMRYCTLSNLIDSMAEREPHSTAIVVYDEGINKSFQDLNCDINRLVHGMLHNLKLKRGDKVGLFSYNNYAFLLVQLACVKLGLIFNAINPSYKAHEFSYVLGKANPKVLFMPGKNSRQSELNDHWSIICDESITDLKNDGKLNDLSHIIIMDGDYNEDQINLEGVKVEPWRSCFTSEDKLCKDSRRAIESVSSDDIYGVYYTSGTTGHPKGAAITQFNVINNSWLSCERLFVERAPHFETLRPNICLPLPLFHEFAGVLGIISPFVRGGSIVFPGMRYSIQSVVDSIMRFRCNSVFLTPTILIDLLSYVERHDIRNVPLRLILVAGSPVMSELVNKTHRILSGLEELRIGYGSSENGVIASIQTTMELTETKPFTVGPPLDFTEIRIVDHSTGETTSLGRSGEVQTRGHNTMLCYYDDPDKTDEVITGSRWYRTGDLGILDKQGSLQIVGRIKDMIIKGGENIYPAEVEAVLHTHQAIEDAHVFGVPDKRFGEEVCTWVKLKDDEDIDQTKMSTDINEFCKQRLTYFKVPKYVIFVKEFPVTPVKKIKKFEMRAQTAKMLNLN